MIFFPKLNEKELPVAKIEEIITANLVQGINDSEFDVKSEEPADLSENDRMCRDELFSENKKVVYIMRGAELIAVVGYKDS